MTDQSKHIHIVGCSPRSGTTLMQEMMVTCFEIDAYCEHEQSIFKAPRVPRGILCTKHPREVAYMGCVLRHNPAVYVIYVVRDPRDVIVSQHKKSPGRYYSDLGFWKEADRYAQKLEGRLHFIVVRYEDLVTYPDHVQQQLEKALPFLRRRQAFSQFHLYAKVSEQSAMALNGVRPVDSSSIGRWRQHLDRVSSQILQHGDISSRLVHYGYEPDNAWRAGLPANPVQHESVIEIRETWLDRLRFAWRIRRKCLQYWLSMTRFQGDTK